MSKKKASTYLSSFNWKRHVQNDVFRWASQSTQSDHPLHIFRKKYTNQQEFHARVQLSLVVILPLMKRALCTEDVANNHNYVDMEVQEFLNDIKAKVNAKVLLNIKNYLTLLTKLCMSNPEHPLNHTLMWPILSTLKETCSRMSSSWGDEDGFLFKIAAFKPSANVMSIRPLLRPLQKKSKEIPLFKTAFLLFEKGVIPGVGDYQIQLIKEGKVKESRQLHNVQYIHDCAAISAYFSKEQSDKGKKSTPDPVLAAIKKLMKPQKKKGMPFKTWWHNPYGLEIEGSEDEKKYIVRIDRSGKEKKASYSTIKTWYSTSDK